MNASSGMRVVTVLSLLFLVAAAIVTTWGLRLEAFADDKVYLAVARDSGAWAASVESYAGWSGRFVINYLLFTTIVSPWAWPCVIVAALVLLGFSVARLGIGRTMPWLGGSALAVAALVYLTDRRVQFQGMWWVTGSFNYLVPVALGLFAVGVLLNARDAGPLERACGLVAAAFAAYQEQMAVSLAAAAVGVVAWQWWHLSVQREAPGRSGRGLGYSAWFAVVVLANAAIQLLAPGNQARAQIEANTWFPQFASLSWPHKLMLGAERLVAHLVTPNTRVFHLLFAVTFIIVWQRRKDWGRAATAAMLVLSLHAVFMLLRLPLFGSHLPYPAWTIPNLATGLDVSWFAMVWVPLVAGVMMGVRLMLASSLGERCLAALAWVVAAGSVVMVGLSPTIYASGWRILFVADVVLVIVLLDLVRKVGWLAGPSGLWILGGTMAGAALRVVWYGPDFFLR